METDIGIEGIEEGKFEGSWVWKNGSSPSTINQIADPVMYKLVRVEGDGRMVLATDEEVMDVEGLLMDCKNDMHIVADAGRATGCLFSKGSSFGMLQQQSSEGLSQSETKVDADQLNARFEEAIPSPFRSLSDCPTNGMVGPCSNVLDNCMEGGSSTSTITSSRPDFSKIKGEICLDNLSIKELHETFRATFGRETTVKDKMWLKRRITMGLTNSCDVSSTTFIIKDNKLVKKGNGESSDKMKVTFSGDANIVTRNDDCNGLSIGHVNQQQDHQVVSDNNKDGTCENIDNHSENRATKRVRKPTRRYIEELSEVEPREASGGLRTPAPNPAVGCMSSKSSARPIGNICSDGRTVITRIDSLGGFGIQIPCVSCIRRSRPRTDFMALLKVNPSCMDQAASLVKKALAARELQEGDKSGNKVMKAISAPGLFQQQVVGCSKEDNQFLVMGTIGLRPNHEVKHVDSTVKSVEHVVTLPTAKGGIRRKHHRAWTLSEVVKLVDGVATYGAGRWSEIRRVAFASYSYRTSVDLKDKWRNLLKASFAQTPSDKGMNLKKSSGVTSIPAPILLKVRELAELQAQAPSNFSSSKLDAASIVTSVHERETVYL